MLVDEVLPHQPMRQWVLSFPFPLRFLFASQPAVMGKVLAIVYHTISRLVALVPKPRVNLTRFHGVFAPNSKYRARHGLFRLAGRIRPEMQVWQVGPGQKIGQRLQLRRVTVHTK
jgi:hypothetical protein